MLFKPKFCPPGVGLLPTKQDDAKTTGVSTANEVVLRAALTDLAQGFAQIESGLRHLMAQHLLRQLRRAMLNSSGRRPRGA